MQVYVEHCFLAPHCLQTLQVVLLLRSSDRVAHDVQLAIEYKEDDVQLVLALRKWQHLRPEREFRCFVRDRRLVGASLSRNRRHHQHPWQACASAT